MADGTKYFSVLSLIIMFRETIEAAIIVAILLSITSRVDRRLNKQVWIGAGAGILCSVAIGVAFIVAFVALQQSVFSGKSKAIFEGVLSWFAAALVTVLSFAMLKLVNIEAKLQRKLTAAAEKVATGSKKYGILFLAFAAVIREGVESVIFLAGIGTNTPVEAIPIPAVVGIILGVIVGVLVYLTGTRIKQLKAFFVLSAVFLFFIAGGLISYGAVEFQGAELFGRMYYWWENREWYLRPVWDGRNCCSTAASSDNKLFLFLRAVFGFSELPTPLLLLLYFSYWVLIIVVIVYKLYRGNMYGVDEADSEQETELPVKVEDVDGLPVVAQDAMKAIQLVDGISSGSSDYAHDRV